jgi:hypothetical protein
MIDVEKLVSLSLAEKCGDTLIIQIEKALYSYTRVYPTGAELGCAFGDDCQWINRRTTRRTGPATPVQYGPAKLSPNTA